MSCPATPTSLAPTERSPAPPATPRPQADLDAGSITNKATGHGFFGTTAGDSNQDPRPSPRTRRPRCIWTSRRHRIAYVKGTVISYELQADQNNGNVTLVAPFTVNDDQASGDLPGDADLARADRDDHLHRQLHVTQADLDTARSPTRPPGTATSAPHRSTPTRTPRPSPPTADAGATWTSRRSRDLRRQGTTISYSYLADQQRQRDPGRPFTVTDDKATVSCPATPTSLARPRRSPAPPRHTITQADLDAGSITNNATGHGYFGATPVDSNQDTKTVTATRRPRCIWTSRRAPIVYITGRRSITTATCDQHGNVTLSRRSRSATTRWHRQLPGDADLAGADRVDHLHRQPTRSTQADLDAGSITNKATGHASCGTTSVDSNQDTKTVTATQTPALNLDKSAAPLRTPGRPDDQLQLPAHQQRQRDPDAPSRSATTRSARHLPGDADLARADRDDHLHRQPHRDRRPTSTPARSPTTPPGTASSAPPGRLEPGHQDGHREPDARR